MAVLPGELFGYYRWGDTMDPVGPALSERAAAHPRDRALRRPPLEPVPGGRGRPRAAGPARAGPARAAAAAHGRGQRARAGRRPAGAKRRARPRASRAGSARRSRWLRRPAQATDRACAWSRRAGGEGPTRASLAAPLPDCGRRPTPCACSLQSGVTVLDGDAHGIAALAAHGALPAGALRYAGDLAPASCATRSSAAAARAHRLEPAPGRELRPPAASLRPDARPRGRHLARLADVRAVRPGVERPAHARALQRASRDRVADPGRAGDLPGAPAVRRRRRRPLHVLARRQEPRGGPALDRAALPPPARARGRSGCSRTRTPAGSPRR